MTATVTAITTSGVTKANSNLYSFLANIASVSGGLPGSFTGVDTIDNVKIKFTSATNDFTYDLGGNILSGTVTGLTIVFHGVTILTETFSSGLDIALVHAAADAFFNSNYTDHSALDAIFDTIPYDFTGNKGPDQFGGGSAADTVLGGAGNDTIFGTLGADILDGGGGINTLSYANDTVGISLGLGGANLSLAGSLAQNDVVTNFRNVIGGSGEDDIDGDNLANKLGGGGGDDFLEGKGGNDKLIGGIGSDTAGYDQAAKAVKVSLAIKLAQNTHGAGKDTLVSIENLTGSHFADTLIGNGGDNKFFGGFGNDLLKGGGGNDTLNGEANDDILNGGAGNDTLNGGAGTDLLQGSTGNDSLNGDADNDTLLGGAGNDTLHGGSENDVLDGGSGNDTLDGDTGNDTATYASAIAAVTVELALGTATGGAGTDTLANIDNLIGSKFADTLTGDGNDNVINGGVGNDIIEGGAGADFLDGGAGINTISYSGDTVGVRVNLLSNGVGDNVTPGSDANGDNTCSQVFRTSLGGLATTIWSATSAITGLTVAPATTSSAACLATTS